MKQHITKEQWCELNTKQKLTLLRFFFKDEEKVKEMLLKMVGQR